MISELTTGLQTRARDRAFADSYWEAAFQAALRATNEAEYVLVPAEFLPLHERFAPLEYSWAIDADKRIAWCCSKDDVDRLAPWLHASAGRASHCAWANEVFVLGSAFERAHEPDAASRRHFVAWQENLERYRSGIPARAANERLVDNGAADSGRDSRLRVLVVGASNMGNVGDDLLADVLADMLGEHDADVFLSGPDIDPLRVCDYDQVIVGGGGLLYASRDGTNEMQNLCNYLKFGPIGTHFGVPCSMIGIGHQDYAGLIESDALSRSFAERCIAQFDEITTRDAESTALLNRLGGERAQTAGDLLFAWTERARSAVKPSVTQPGRVAFVGEIFDHPSLAEHLGNPSLPFEAALRDGDFDVLVMSNDDVGHARRLQGVLQSAGASAAVVDLRGRDFETL
ncbi:MAG TPA: polysaccharide pyruvyl transferase family protein, partial [Gammaproteobacteria bacterium]|nr:polysaccharide pyruvyl transferase family protein [Gammaproteobacteria bacterium]